MADAIIRGLHGCSREETYQWPEDPVVRQKLEWFRDQKLGLMMHFGIYSQLGICRAENGKGFTAELGRFAALVTDLPVQNAPGPVFGLNDYDEITEFIINNREGFTHFNAQDRARMVDAGEKEPASAPPQRQ